MVSRLAALVLCASLCTAAPLVSQTDGARVLLQIRPKVGDTLHVRLEHEMVRSGTRRMGNKDTTRSMTDSLLIFSRTLVEESDDEGTTVRIVTDSMTLLTAAGADASYLEQQRRQIQGKTMRVRFTPQGSATVLEASAELTRDVQSLFSLPATLPKVPVTVGETWSQVIPIPMAGQQDARDAGILRATFRLDSVARGGTAAYLSVRGTLTRDSTATDMPPGRQLSMNGSVTGTMLLDRKRGWITDARTTMSIKSVMSYPARSDQQPVRMQMRITQRTRTMEIPER